MKASSFFVFAALPIIASCFHANFGPYDVQDRMMIYRGVYMYGLESGEQYNQHSKSRLHLKVHALPSNSARMMSGTIITAFMSDEAFEHLGYVNATGHRVPCCDEAGYSNGQCNHVGELVVPSQYIRQVHMEYHNVSKTNEINHYYNVGYTGMFYVVTAVCDAYAIGKVSLEGEMIAENPYGHLPATMYSSLPFYSYMVIIYVVVLIMWGMLCIQYSKEIMSVHIIILIVLIAFVLNYSMKVLHLWFYNTSGYDVLVYISVAMDVFTRTLTRILTILVCMGLGVSRASITDQTLKLTLFAIAYFAINLWDSILAIGPMPDPSLSKIRVYGTAGMDALVYFWVFQSLMNTIDDLKQNKQNQKLSVFMRLYSLLLISVVVSTLTLLCFSYIVNNAGDKPIWKYQWFMNEGVWSIYYFILFLCLMLMWKPNENSSAYAYHIELATDMQEDEEYGLPQDKLIESDEEGNIEVSVATEQMKPMGITAGVQK